MPHRRGKNSAGNINFWRNSFLIFGTAFFAKCLSSGEELCVFLFRKVCFYQVIRKKVNFFCLSLRFTPHFLITSFWRHGDRFFSLPSSRKMNAISLPPFLCTAGAATGPRAPQARRRVPPPAMPVGGAADCEEEREHWVVAGVCLSSRLSLQVPGKRLRWWPRMVADDCR